MASILKVCQLGVGNWGQIVADKLRRTPGAEFVGAFDADPMRTTIKAPNWRAALERLRPDAVVVCTPAGTHAEVAEFTTRRAIPSLVEKPLCTDSIALTRLRSVAGGRRLMAGHILRFCPAYAELERLVSQQRFGTARSVTIQRASVARCRGGESAWITMAPHDLSTLFALGAGPLRSVRITGSNAQLRARLEFTTLRAVLSYDTRARKRRRELSLRTDAATLHLDESAPAKLTATTSTGARSMHIPQGDALQLELEHFISCVRDGAPFRTGIEEAAPVVRALELGIEAMQAWQRPSQPQAAWGCEVAK